jgi:hypothetical protein
MIGWIQAYGPALHNLNRDETLTRIFETAADFGFHEGVSFEELKKVWGSARSRWSGARKDAKGRYVARVPSTSLAEVVGAGCSATPSPLDATPSVEVPGTHTNLGDGAPLYDDVPQSGLTTIGSIEPASRSNADQVRGAEPTFFLPLVVWAMRPRLALTHGPVRSNYPCSRVGTALARPLPPRSRVNPIINLGRARGPPTEGCGGFAVPIPAFHGQSPTATAEGVGVRRRCAIRRHVPEKSTPCSSREGVTSIESVSDSLRGADRDVAAASARSRRKSRASMKEPLQWIAITVWGISMAYLPIVR